MTQNLNIIDNKGVKHERPPAEYTGEHQHQPNDSVSLVIKGRQSEEREKSFYPHMMSEGLHFYVVQWQSICHMFAYLSNYLAFFTPLKMKELSAANLQNL